MGVGQEGSDLDIYVEIGGQNGYGKQKKLSWHGNRIDNAQPTIDLPRIRQSSAAARIFDSFRYLAPMPRLSVKDHMLKTTRGL
ncbi:hypothetical protein ACLKA7_009093 [Drosophila subpalustris]